MRTSNWVNFWASDYVQWTFEFLGLNDLAKSVEIMYIVWKLYVMSKYWVM